MIGRLSSHRAGATFKLALYGNAGEQQVGGGTYGQQFGAYQTVDTVGNGVLNESPVLVTGVTPVLFTGVVGSTGLVKGHAAWGGTEGDWCGFQLYEVGSNLLPIATPVNIGANATLDLGGVSQQVASLADYGSGGYGYGSIINSVLGTTSVLTLSPTSGSTTFSGTILSGGTNGAISLVISGTGTQVLSGANTYSGPTLITAGTLRAGTAFALSASSDVTITGGVLDATGGSQTVNSLTVGAAGSLNLYIGDVLAIGGSATFDPGSTLNLSNLGVLHSGFNELMSYVGSYTGDFTHVTNGLTLDYSHPNEIGINFATTSIWTGTDGPIWSHSGSWTGGEPNTAGAQATVTKSTSSDLTITLDGAKTIGTLELGSGTATAGYNLSGGSAEILTFDNNGLSTIAVNDGKHAIDAPVNLTNGLAVSGSGTLTFSGSISGTAPEPAR